MGTDSTKPIVVANPRFYLRESAAENIVVRLTDDR
jgi:hypothetical protein